MLNLKPIFFFCISIPQFQLWFAVDALYPYFYAYTFSIDFKVLYLILTLCLLRVQCTLFQ